MSMSPESFAYWLQGFFEVMDIGGENDTKGIHPEQAKMIKDHLQLVFNKVTPDREVNVENSKIDLKDLISKKKDLIGGPFVGPISATAKVIGEFVGDVPILLSC